MKKVLSLLFLFFFVINADANFSIKIKVVDESTKEAIDFADVFLFENDKLIQHKLLDAGNLVFHGVSKGVYTLRIQLIGFDIYTHNNIVVDTKDLDLGLFGLKQLEHGLAAVEVVANKKQVVYKLDKRIIDAGASLLTGTAVDILENTPSIRVDAEGGLSFRGSSGFKVYIDGKPSIFGGSQALEQIPSSQIDNIEIITTPSARYDTDGDVGIINIVTKKNVSKGINGLFNINGSSFGSRGIDFLISHEKGDKQWYIGGNASQLSRKSHFEQLKTTIINDTSTTSNAQGKRESINYDYSFKTGLRMKKAKNFYEFEAEVGYQGRKRDGDLAYEESRSSQGNLFDNGVFTSRDKYDLHETYGQITNGYKHQFDEHGHFLSANAYVKYGGNALEYFKSDLFDADNKRHQGHQAWEAEYRWTVRANIDYVLPYREGGKFETGYQYFSYLEDGDYKMEYWDPSSQSFYWRDDIYNTFYFQRGINSVYTVFTEGYKALDFQLGLRGEHTHQVLRSSKTWANRVKNRFEIFPSAHVGLSLGDQSKFIAAFSRRTTRPELFFMEPYITFRDYYSAEIGNPDIRPEYINSFELLYKTNIRENTYSASLFHRSRKDKIERLRVPYEAGITLDSMANVGRDYSTGVEISASLKMARFWNMNINGSVYHYKLKNDFNIGGKNENSSNYDLSWANYFDLNKKSRLQLDGNFVGPSVTTQGKTNAFYYFNLAWRQQLIQRKLQATLSFRNVFGTARYVSKINTSNLISETRIKPQTPLISLSLSYTFNNFNSRNAQQKESNDIFEGTNH